MSKSAGASPVGRSMTGLLSVMHMIVALRVVGFPRTVCIHAGAGPAPSKWDPMSLPVTRRRLTPPVLLAIVVVALVLTGIRPYDRLTWLLETFWVMLGIPLVLLTWRRFPLTTLLCCL